MTRRLSQTALWTMAAMGCGKPDEPPVSEPTPTATGTPPAPEIPGDGIDEAGNGWDDEYGGGAPDADLPTFIGTYSAVTLGTGEGEGWLIAAADGGGRVPPQLPAVYAWSQGLYGFPYGVLPSTADERFAVAVAGLDHFFALTAPAADAPIALELYTLPPSVAVGAFDDVDGTDLGILLRAADIDGSGNPALLAGDGANTRLVVPPWTSPSSPGRWVGAGAELGDTADFDGDGANDVSLGDGVDAWIAAGDVVGDVAIADGAVRISPAGDFTAAGAGFAPGDVDGDGYQDLALPATGDADDRGGIWLLSGPFDADRTAEDAVATIVGTYAGEHCAVTAPAFGERLAVGCPGGEVLPGRLALFGFDVLSGEVAIEDAAESWVGPSPGAGLGALMAGGIDVTGDARADLVATGDALFVVPGVP